MTDSCLSDLTHVIYAHLEKTDFFCKKLKIHDKLGRAYEIDLDSTGFILQKKMELIGDALQKTNDDKKIKEILSKYLLVMKRRAERGVWIKDHNNFLTNYGFVNVLSLYKHIDSSNQSVS